MSPIRKISLFLDTCDRIAELIKSKVHYSVKKRVLQVAISTQAYGGDANMTAEAAATWYQT